MEEETQSLDDMLREWKRYQPSCVRYQGDTVELLYDGYGHDLRAEWLDGMCGYSECEAMVFIAVCSAIEDASHGYQGFFEGLEADFDYTFSCVTSDEKPYKTYYARISWERLHEPTLSFDATHHEGRGSAMLEAWLKLCRYAQEMKRERYAPLPR